MKVFSRMVAVLLAGMLVFSTGMAFAANPNANPNAFNKNKMENPAKIKTMAKLGIMDAENLEDLIDAIEITDLHILPTESPNVVRIAGSIELDSDYDLTSFKGNTKFKLKMNNVTVNVDKYGDFSQAMPIHKLTDLVISVYVGHIFLFTVDEDELEDIIKPITVEQALLRAEVAIDRLPEDLDDLTIEDRKLVERARMAVDILEAVLDEEGFENGDDEYEEFEDFLAIVEEAEGILRELLEEYLEWDTEPYNVRDNIYYGKLMMDNILAGRVMILIENDEEIIPSANGRFFFELDADDDILIEVFLDGTEIDDLQFTIEVD